MMIKARGKKGTLELRRRVPKKYASVEPRQVIWVSLGTDSPSVAGVRASSRWDQQIAQWEAMLAGESLVPEARLEAAVNRHAKVTHFGGL